MQLVLLVQRVSRK